MKKSKVDRRNVQTESTLVRASISFPPDLCKSLQEIARQKKVSLAWVARNAAEKYVAKDVRRKVEGEAV